MATNGHTPRGDDFETPDDLDRLMARRQSPPPPRSLVPAILAATTRRTEGAGAATPAQAVLWAAYVALLLLVAGGAVLFGGALHGGGTLDYLAFAASDADLLRESPALFRDAVLETMPWGHVAALAIALVGWFTVTAMLLRRSPARPNMTRIAP